MFFEKKYRYDIIEDVAVETLQEFSTERGINMEVGVVDSNDWAIFAQYYGTKNGLNFVESVSFAYMISLFLSGMGVSASTEYYLKEELIEFNIIDALNEIKAQIDDEDEQVKTLFEYIFILYKDKLDPYWKKTERLDMRVSYKQHELFDKLPGQTKNEKLQTLLNLYYEDIEGTNNLPEGFNEGKSTMKEYFTAKYGEKKVEEIKRGIKGRMNVEKRVIEIIHKEPNVRFVVPERVAKPDGRSNVLLVCLYRSIAFDIMKVNFKLKSLNIKLEAEPWYPDRDLPETHFIVPMVVTFVND